MAEAVSDERVAQVLGLYAGMVGHVLHDPRRWLGLDVELPADAKLPRRAVELVRDKVLGDVTPASDTWSSQPEQHRVDWWVKRIGLSAGFAAAAPRVAGALSDRVPLQAALGASAAGLAVCATAREHGVTDPAAWVPLLAQVLFDRELTAGPAPEADQHAEEALSAADSEEDAGRLNRFGRGAKTAARTVWRLARALLGIQDLLDERPRGNLLVRGLGKLPLVGLPAGFLDERGGIKRASKETTKLLRRTPELEA